jgi:hypothetical protein
VSSLLHVANVLANKMTNRRRFNMPYQVCPENKSSIQRDHHIQAFAGARSRNLPA